jgi:hypothetical protein
LLSLFVPRRVLLYQIQCKKANSVDETRIGKPKRNITRVPDEKLSGMQKKSQKLSHLERKIVFLLNSVDIYSHESTA